MPEKEAKLSSRTTNKDHFKNWNSEPAKVIPEYPEFAGYLMYPNDKRKFLTTNEELFYKNYGKFKANSTAMNIFENTFKISQGKMNLDTVYNNDYHKLDIKKLLRERGPIVTKEMVERKGQKIVNKIPMDTTTMSMVDYKYDPETFHSVTKVVKQPYSYDLFRSKLNRADLNPLDSETPHIVVDDDNNFESNYQISFRDKTSQSAIENSRSKPVQSIVFGESHLTHAKNIVIFVFLEHFNSLI